MIGLEFNNGLQTIIARRAGENRRAEIGMEFLARPFFFHPDHFGY